jgi:hypothetical protein
MSQCFGQNERRSMGIIWKRTKYAKDKRHIPWYKHILLV